MMKTWGRFFYKVIMLSFSLGGIVSAFGQSSILSNPGFESGTAPWQFFSDGVATFTTNAAGAGSAKAGLVAISSPGSNVQLFQTGFPLEANTQYTLAFIAYSNSGHDLSVTVQKHTPPYSSYGLIDKYFNLTSSWGTYTVQFTTSGFSGTATDTRLRLWLAPFDAANDQYFFDDIVLSRTGASTGPTTITSHPASQSVSSGQAATFNVAASGTAPLSYQWQKNSSNIGGATDAAYTTPANTMADNGALIRCIVSSSSSGNATSNTATLSVTTTPPPTAGTNVLANPSFESGTASWNFYTNGGGALAIVTPGTAGSSAARVNITGVGNNVQFYQFGFTLEPGTRYVLKFDARANVGRTITASVAKHLSPYSNYGLSTHPFTLGASWQAFTVTFTTSGFPSPVSDARLMLWFANQDAAGDQYFFDNIILATEGSALPTPLSITAQPSNQTVSAGQSATFIVSASGTAPLAFQWQKNSANIAGATSAAYTTPATTSSDNGSTFRSIVSNSTGSVTSNQASLTVTTAIVGGTRGRVRIVNNTVVADNGALLRGEHLLMTTWNMDRIADSTGTWYNRMSVRYHFNVVRLLCYRNPIYISGYVCDPSTQCMPVSSVIPLLDIAVEKARQAGLYAIIDYHPLGGYNEADAISWWNAVAPRYQHLPHVIYEITNEPCGTEGSSPPGLAAYEQRMYNLVRSMAPNTHLIMWSFPAGTDGFFAAVRSTTGISYANASVGVHIYGTNWSHVSALRQTHPVFMTEAQSCQGTPTQCQNSTGSYLAAAAQFESYGLSWILLKAIPVANGHPDLLANVNPIPWPIDPYFGAPTAPSGQDTLSTSGLAQNYPNPFNPSTEIRFRVGTEGLTTLKVYNVLGQEVATLVNENRSAGAYSVTWNGNNQNGTPVASGMYLYRITTTGQTQSMVSELKRMILLR